MASSPSPIYYKDGNGHRPRWRLFFLRPSLYLWLIAPSWLVRWKCRWNDRRVDRERDRALFEAKRKAGGYGNLPKGPK